MRKVRASAWIGVVIGLSVLAARAEDSAWDARFEPRFKGVLKPGTEYRAVVTLEKPADAKAGAPERRFTILFDPAIAPNHVANFVALARKGFYDGTTFHRVLPGFMAQGGDPTGSGSGGPGYTVRHEFNGSPHVRGTVSMARTRDPDSAGSQFFICFQAASQLDGQYTVFGHVVEGMEVVDGIRPRDPDRRPDYTGDRMVKVEIVERAAAGGPAPAPAK